MAYRIEEPFRRSNTPREMKRLEIRFDDWLADGYFDVDSNNDAFFVDYVDGENILYIFDSYDGGEYIELTDDERMKVAEHMIERWNKYKQSIEIKMENE